MDTQRAETNRKQIETDGNATEANDQPTQNPFNGRDFAAQKRANPNKKRPLASDRDLWERQPRETDQSWEAFLLYRGQVGKRLLPRVAATTGKTMTLITRWSARWSWIKRASAYDQYLDRIEVEKDRQAAREMRANHITLGSAMQSLGARVIQALSAKEKPEINIREARQLIEKGTALERISRGEPSQILEHGGTVSYEDLADLAESGPAPDDDEEWNNQ